jgi:membrane protease subunit HflK
MSWNNGGPSGSGGGGSGGGSRPGSGNDSGGGSGDGNRPASPWGNPGGARPERPQRPPGGGGPRGPWGGGGGGGGGQPPDLDELIARLQAFLRGFIPPGFGGGGGPRSGGGGSFPAKRGAFLVVVVALVLWGASGFYRVQPDEQGVVLRFGAYNRTTFPGLNYHIPWPVESVLRPAVTRVNRVEIGYRSQDSNARGGQVSRDVTTEGLMLTGDENIVDINFTVFWRIRDAGAYLFATRNPAETVKSAAESEMREVIGRTPIQPALTDARASIEAAVKKGVQGMMDQYGSGVEITQVQLQKVDPPAAVIESFRDVQRAQTDAERLRNEADTYRNDIVPRARGDAARLVAEADADRQVSVTKATGETERFLSVLKSYDLAKDVTMKRLYLETMQDILSSTPSVIVDDRLQGVVPYLPLTGADTGGASRSPAPPAVLHPETSTGSGAPQR